MARLPKIESEGLRLAKTEGGKRVSSVVNVSKALDCNHSWSDWQITGRTGDWFHPHIVKRTCSKCGTTQSDEH